MPRRATSATIEPRHGRAAGAGRKRRDTARFESLVHDLSAAMALAPAAAVDREIESWLGKICQALDLDRGGIYERHAPDEPLRTTHTWHRANVPPFPRPLDPGKLLPVTTDWILSGKQVAFSRPSELPAELGDLRRFLELNGGPAVAAGIPMWAGDRVIGAATFGKFRSTRGWSTEVLDHLNLAVRLFGSAIERKQSEMATLALRTELRVATRRNLMSELVASLSHEINQPLGAILSNLGGVARLLAQGNSQPALALEAVNSAIEDTKRTAEIVRRIRLMFKRDIEHKTTIDIGALAREVVKLIAGEAAVRKIRVQIEVSPSVPRVVGDAIQLQQCVLNLIMNACDAITEANSERRDISIRAAPEKTGWVAVSVSDSGAGIAPAVANRLFEPFVTTKSDGMGLGLLVTRSIVESHGGRIWATPNPECGTTFTFTLPVAERKRAGASRRAD